MDRKEVVDKYYRLIDIIQRGKNFASALAACEESIQCLPALIQEIKEISPTNSFDVTVIPAIEYGATYYAVLGQRAKLEDLRKRISAFSELS
ncbi:MAG: hypothetical protein V1800_06725, partial [Candidatus Latescibacterota bacterium]